MFHAAVHELKLQAALLSLDITNIEAPYKCKAANHVR